MGDFLCVFRRIPILGRDTKDKMWIQGVQEQFQMRTMDCRKVLREKLIQFCLQQASPCSAEINPHVVKILIVRSFPYPYHGNIHTHTYLGMCMGVNDKEIEIMAWLFLWLGKWKDHFIGELTSTAVLEYCHAILLNIW